MRYLYGFIWFFVLSSLAAMVLSAGVVAYMHYSGAIDLANPPPGANGFAFGEAISRLTTPAGALIGFVLAVFGTAREKLPGTKRNIQAKRPPIQYDRPH